jgi:predicted RNA binding protein YcfA (HicA-like mRNA interferase family)
VKAKLTPISWQELVKRLRALGFEGPFAGGKHLFMLKGALRFTLPNPHKQAVGVALLAKILKQAGVSQDEWLGL